MMRRDAPKQQLDTWHKHFAVRSVRHTYYVSRRGVDRRPVSPDFSLKRDAKSWIRKHWQEMMIEEILIGRRA